MNNKKTVLSVVIPCFNEEATLEKCIDRVKAIADSTLIVEIIIVDDFSNDNSYRIATEIRDRQDNVILLKHDHNQGKGAALRTGFKHATGDFVAVQDADLEYDPQDLKKLLTPLINDDADVVFGSRFLSAGAHRVFHYWHYLGNKFLTTLSNIFTDLNLTDMETCYKVFRRDIIQSVDIKENRFGFEPEIVAKIAQMRIRLFEMGISYYGRSYDEGKKIGYKDGFRALYCILRYNAHKAPLPIQFLVYLFIGGTAAIFNLLIFLFLYSNEFRVLYAAPTAFILAAALNYYLSIKLLFRHTVRWSFSTELIMMLTVVGFGALLDYSMTNFLININLTPQMAKITSTGCVLIYNFLMRRYVVFKEKSNGPWK